MKAGPQPALLPIVCNLVYATMLLVLALTPRLPAAASDFPDDLAHGLAHAGQAVLVYWALHTLTSPLVGAIVAWLGATAFGMTTEVLQSLQPARSGQLSDLLADVIGAGCAVVLLLAARRTADAVRIWAIDRRLARHGG